jgi:hypothetical protein
LKHINARIISLTEAGLSICEKLIPPDSPVQNQIKKGIYFKGFPTMFTEIGKGVFGVLLVILAAAPTRPAWSAGWELVFSDEFDGDKLDRTKWATRYLYNNETMDRFTGKLQPPAVQRMVSEQMTTDSTYEWRKVGEQVNVQAH